MMNNTLNSHLILLALTLLTYFPSKVCADMNEYYLAIYDDGMNWTSNQGATPESAFYSLHQYCISEKSIEECKNRSVFLRKISNGSYKDLPRSEAKEISQKAFAEVIKNKQAVALELQNKFAYKEPISSDGAIQNLSKIAKKYNCTELQIKKTIYTALDLALILSNSIAESNLNCIKATIEAGVKIDRSYSQMLLDKYETASNSNNAFYTELKKSKCGASIFLECAIEKSSIKIIDYLISSNFPWTREDSTFSIFSVSELLKFVIKNDRLDVLKILIEEHKINYIGADDYLQNSKIPSSLLSYATSESMAKYLVEELKLSANDTLALNALVSNSYTDVVAYLLTKDVQIESIKAESFMSLVGFEANFERIFKFRETRNQNQKDAFRLIKMLVNRGYDIKAKENELSEPNGFLTEAFGDILKTAPSGKLCTYWSGRLDLIKYLFKKGAKMPFRLETCVLNRKRTGNYEDITSPALELAKNGVEYFDDVKDFVEGGADPLLLLLDSEKLDRVYIEFAKEQLKIQKRPVPEKVFLYLISGDNRKSVDPLIDKLAPECKASRENWENKKESYNDYIKCLRISGICEYGIGDEQDYKERDSSFIVTLPLIETAPMVCKKP